MRGQKKQKPIKRTRLVQRSLPLLQLWHDGDRPTKAFSAALLETEKFTLAGDFDGCVKLALQREKNV